MVAVSLKKFFFQAEDGIRDTDRSRGLGDVYKRQLPLLAVAGFEKRLALGCIGGLACLRGIPRQQLGRRGRHRLKRCKEQKREELLKHGFGPFKTDANERVLGFS